MTPEHAGLESDVTNRTFVELKFLDTYYFANLVHNVVNEPVEYLPGLESFFGEENQYRFLNPFPKHSRLHEFLEFIIQGVWVEDIDDVELDAIVRNPSHRLPFEQLLEEHRIQYRTLDEWLRGRGQSRADLESEDDLVEYIDALHDDGPLDDLLSRTAGEVFFLLFSNRQFLLGFNEMVAARIRDVVRQELPEHDQTFLKADGVLRRCTIPAWVRRAVFYRERGLCALCHRDISGIVNIQNQKHFDHIVPLHRGGMNDVTNVQLLCDQCNMKKGGLTTSTSPVYESWY